MANARDAFDLLKTTKHDEIYASLMESLEPYPLKLRALQRRALSNTMTWATTPGNQSAGYDLSAHEYLYGLAVAFGTEMSDAPNGCVHCGARITRETCIPETSDVELQTQPRTKEDTYVTMISETCLAPSAKPPSLA